MTQQQYDESVMGGVRQALEEALSQWPRVTTAKKFGCPGYRAGGTLFAVLVTGGVALTQLNEEQRKALETQHAVRPFRAGGRMIQEWAVVPVTDSLQIQALLPFVEQSYRNALGQSTEES
jgi:hypothetical protein